MITHVEPQGLEEMNGALTGGLRYVSSLPGRE
jgi:hypothetical protein